MFLAVCGLEATRANHQTNKESQEYIMGLKYFAEKQSLIYGLLGIQVEIIKNIATVHKKKKVILKCFVSCTDRVRLLAPNFCRLFAQHFK